MKRSVIFMAAFFMAACNNEPEKKYFTGSIEYSYTFTSDSLNADSLTKARPSKSMLRYDTLNYQTKFIATDTSTY